MSDRQLSELLQTLRGLPPAELRAVLGEVFGFASYEGDHTINYGSPRGPAAIYEDKTFTADIDGRRIRTVRIRHTSDVKDVQITIEHLGSLRSTHGFLTAFFWSGW